ncbi:unnamed protein product, partial [Heterosigma akashiwo]
TPPWKRSPRTCASYVPNLGSVREELSYRHLALLASGTSHHQREELFSQGVELAGNSHRKPDDFLRPPRANDFFERGHPREDFCHEGVEFAGRKSQLSKVQSAGRPHHEEEMSPIDRLHCEKLRTSIATPITDKQQQTEQHQSLHHRETPRTSISGKPS